MTRNVHRVTGVLAALAIGINGLVSPSFAQVKPALDRKIPGYVLAKGVTGSLTILGSETMQPFTKVWAEELRRFYSGLAIRVESLGSETGLAALLEGKAQIAAMSRRMTSQEISDFIRAFGYEPTEVPVAVDALTVYVNRENLIVGLTLPELDSMFCTERRRGLKYRIETWGDLGLDTGWADAAIHLYGRDALSGTSTFFREHVCDGAGFHPTMTKAAGSASVVVDIMKDRYGIGYSGIGYRTSSVRPVPLAAAPGMRYVEPTFQTIMDGSYPLRRTLYLYVNRPPNLPPSPALVEFVKFAVSLQGQQVVLNHGFFPLNTDELSRLMTLWSSTVKAASVENRAKPGN
jgi:phosphate transport system substrate-binding protein